MSLNKYVQGLSSGDAIFGSVLMPINRVGNTTTRSWNDRTTFAAGDPRNGTTCRTAIWRCPAPTASAARMANQNFGRATGGNVYDPTILEGWGVRGYNWEFSAGVQQEILPRVSLDVSYFRRWYGNFFVIDNRAVSPATSTAFSVTAPNTDSRLPSAGETITGFYDLNPNKVGQVDNYVTKASNYGDQSETWSGVDVNLSARMRGGLLLQGGTSTGRTSTDTCEIRAAAARDGDAQPVLRRLDAVADAGQVRGRVHRAAHRRAAQRHAAEPAGSGAERDLRGVERARCALARAAALGRRGQRDGEPHRAGLDQLRPLHAARSAHRQVDPDRHVRAAVNLDIFNALNASSVLAVNNVFGGATPWLSPQSIMQGRLLKISGQFDF